MESKEPKQSCDQCGADAAVVHLTQIVSNEMKTSHLCEKCAAVKGVEGVEEPINFPLTGFLAQLTDAPDAEDPPETLGPCSFCGLTFENFREAGRLGCPHCYTTYESYLRGLLRRVHGSTQHVGKVYLPPDPAASDVESRWRLSAISSGAQWTPKISRGRQDFVTKSGRWSRRRANHIP